MSTYHRDHLLNCLSAGIKRKIPYGWDLNIYRGLQPWLPVLLCHWWTHGFTGLADFSTNISVKTNVVEVLEKQPSFINLETGNRQYWRRYRQLSTGGSPVSADAKILKLLIKYKTPAIISTKSDLVLRDYDLIDELSQITYINVAATVTTLDEAIRKIEPGAVSGQARFAMPKNFQKKPMPPSVTIWCRLFPPWLMTPKPDRFVFAAGQDAGIDYVLPGALYLRGATKPAFLTLLIPAIPKNMTPSGTCYKRRCTQKEYKDELYGRLNPLRQSFGLSNSYSKPIKAKLKVYPRQKNRFHTPFLTPS